MDLLRFQKETKEWQNKNFGEDQPAFFNLLGLAEEVGELCHAHLKGLQGIRHSHVEIRELKRDAVGDIMIFLANYCSAEGIDMELAVQKTWDQVKERDWSDSL